MPSPSRSAALPWGDGRRVRRRHELLAIASELFATDGYAGVTMDDIGEAAGVSGPALYHHFESKEAMLGEMLVGISEHLLSVGKDITARTDRAHCLDALVEMHIDFAVDRRALITVHFRDLVQASDQDQRRVHDLQRAYVDLWVDALLHLRPALGPRVGRAAVHATFGLINSTPISGRLRRDDMVRVLRCMAAGAMSGLGNYAAAAAG